MTERNVAYFLESRNGRKCTHFEKNSTIGEMCNSQENLNQITLSHNLQKVEKIAGSNQKDYRWVKIAKQGTIHNL